MPFDETRNNTVRAVVFGMFFMTLMVMLVFSSGIILYGSLFRSREIGFLLTISARAERVFLHKFQEAIVLSSWGFLLLVSPMLLAYGMVEQAPWYYYAMLVPFLVAFVYVPSSMGAIICLGIVRRLPGSRLQVFVAAVILLIGAGGWFAWWVATGPQSDLLTPGWFQEMTSRMQISEGRLLPSWWLGSGLLEAAGHMWSESLLFLVLLIANALFFRQLAIWIAGRVYRPAYSALFSKHTDRRRARWVGFERLLSRGGELFSPQMRLVMIKDLRQFWRDPAQWSQFLIFFALLALYFLNIRHFTYSIQYVGWVNVVSFLNLSVVGLLMSTFTTRFIFPMISLEGRRFWILGMLPIRRETILWAKFLFAIGSLILPCSGLILLSDLMLRVSPIITISHQLTCVILCVGLSGIAVGLGARLPNLREQSPSRIAAGFGGTLNLVVSALYILAVVLLTAVPCHFYLAAAGHAESAKVLPWLRIWLSAGIAASLLLGLLATVVPLCIGFRAFRRLEF